MILNHKFFSFLRELRNVNLSGKGVIFGASLSALILALAYIRVLEIQPISTPAPDGRLSTQLASKLASALSVPFFPHNPSNQPCDQEQAVEGSSNVVITTMRSLVDWLTIPEVKLGKALWDMGPELLAYTNPSPWPTLHEQARLAKVPVIMYHDILPEPEVFFDVTPEQLEADFQLIQEQGLTPISLDQLVNHLRTGVPLPEKPILLTFDDGYKGHYIYVYPLLRKYNYPAAFSIFTAKVDGDIVGRSTLTWWQLRHMAADPLVTIAAHSVTHPPDLTALPDNDLEWEVMESKQVLETRLGIPIRHFTYPAGHYDQRVIEAIEKGGYSSALTMDDNDERFAGESENLLAIARFGQSRIEDIIDQAWGGPPLPNWDKRFQFDQPIHLIKTTIDEIPLTLIMGGRPITIHADSRYQVPEIITETAAVAAVNGGFFSLKYLDSNTMIGPVLSQHTGEFVPGNTGENPLLTDRPLVLISPNSVEFIPFDPDQHNTLAGVTIDHPGVTDAFVAAAWLVKQNQAQPASAFGDLFDYDAKRHRAFWGINQAGQPVIGVSNTRVNSVRLGEILWQAGFRDAVMLDSGGSTSLVYGEESLVSYLPRPVPHVMALVPPSASTVACPISPEEGFKPRLAKQ